MSVINKLLISLALLAGAIAIIVATQLSPKSPPKEIQVVQFHKDIREHLLLGSSRAVVIAYLDSRKIYHSYFEQKTDHPQDYRNEVAYIRFPGDSVRQATRITAVFYFDNKDRLVHYSLKYGQEQTFIRSLGDVEKE